MHRNCTATLAALRVAGLCQSPFLLPNWVPSNRTGRVAGMQELFDTIEHCNRANASSYVRWAIFREGADNGVFVAQRPQPSARFINPAP